MRRVSRRGGQKLQIYSTGLGVHSNREEHQLIQRNYQSISLKVFHFKIESTIKLPKMKRRDKLRELFDL